jgi:tetratricopeptide (TPR) repeat protein
MYDCPACGAAVAAGAAACRSCGADLGLLRAIDAVPDAWFNRGLDAIAAGHPGRAVEWFAAACAAKPGDSRLWLALARAWARLGRPAEALGALSRAVDAGAVPEEAAVLRAAISPGRGRARKAAR